MTLPAASVKVGWLPRLSTYRPRSVNCWSLMVAAAAVRLRTLIWLLPLNTMPLRLTIISVPSALIVPWIWLGATLLPTRLSSAQLASCWKVSWVSRPTLKVSQLRIALSAVCLIVTWVVPPFCVCTGASALVNNGLPLASSSGFRPLPPRPLWMLEGAASAAARPAAWAACCAAMAATVLLRFCSERCNWALARCCWASGGGSPGNCTAPPCPPVPPACGALPLAANQAELNAAGAACTLPARASSAITWASGLSRSRGISA